MKKLDTGGAGMIHPTAIIDSAAEIGADVEIGPYAVLEGPVRVGDGCRIMAHAWVGGDTSLGKGCVVHPFAALGGLPQDFSYDSGTMRSGLQVGERAVFREGVTVHRSARDGGKTIVGNDVYMMACSHVGHDANIGDNVTMANSALLAGYVVVCDRAFISGNVSIHQHVRIGRFAMIGASSFVSQDIPPFCTVQGVPARVVCINNIGLKRNGFDQDRRSLVKTMFRMLYRQGLALSAVLEKLDALGGEDAMCLAEFLRGSKRGIAAGRGAGRDHEQI